MTARDKPTDFLSRWSQRKTAAREENVTPRPETETAPHDREPPEPALDALPDDEALARLKLPDPERMSAGDDFSAFMKSGVPARLRNRALRKLWVANPALANLDELLDYGEDFTDAATVIENLTTAYQVGRGFLRDEPEAVAATTTSETELAGSDRDDAGEGPPLPSEGAEVLSDAEDKAAATPLENADHGSVLASASLTPEPKTVFARHDNNSELMSEEVNGASEPPLKPRRRMSFAFETDS